MIVVLGAGLAGLSAAIHLAERGMPVTLCEAHPEFLGGRTRARRPYSFEWRGETHTHSLDHGQHCMWRQYHNMRALLARLGMLEKSTMACEHTSYVVDVGDEVHRLARFDVHPDRAPKTLAGFFAHLARATRVPGWTHKDTLRLVRALPRLAAAGAFEHAEHYERWDTLSVAELFAWIGLPAQMDLVFKSLCKASTFHPHAEISASWGLSMMESTMIGHPGDHSMWCFRGNLGTHLIDPLAARLRALGGTILKDARALRVGLEGGRVSAVHLSGGRTIACDALVCATDIPGFREAMLPALADRPEVRRTANLDTIANVTVRVVTSRPVRRDDTWLGIFAGRFAVLDTYFLVSRYQDEFVEWAQRTGGEVIELHVYLAQRELANAPPEVVRDLVTREVVRAWPEFDGAIVHVEHFVNERTFDKQGVGYAQHQPRMRTSVPNLFLCGSWIKVDAAIHDMEKAVTTGIEAANAILEQHGKMPWPVLPLRAKTRAQRLFARVAPRLLPMPPGVRRAV